MRSARISRFEYLLTCNFISLAVCLLSGFISRDIAVRRYVFCYNPSSI